MNQQDIVKKMIDTTYQKLETIFNKERTFKDLVIINLVNIVMHENGISEKDFSKTETIKQNITKLINQHTYLNDFIAKFKDKRDQLVAELIYDEIKTSISF